VGQYSQSLHPLTTVRTSAQGFVAILPWPEQQPKAHRERFVVPCAERLPKQTFVLRCSALAQTRAQVERPAGYVAVQLAQHQFSCASVEVLEVECHLDSLVRTPRGTTGDQ
jgi:hypothetical protein